MINNKEYKINGRSLIGVNDANCIVDYVNIYTGIKPEDIDAFNKGEEVQSYTCVEDGALIYDYTDTFEVIKVEVLPKFLNVSNHILSPEQKEDINKALGQQVNIVELPEDLKNEWGNMSPDNYKKVVNKVMLHMMQNNIKHAHLAGFMPAVAYAMKYKEKFNFFYAYSIRESVEKVVDGATIKTAIFKHKGWFRYE